MSYEVHVLEPTGLAPRSAPDGETFRRIWSRLGMNERAGDWHGSVRVDDPQGRLFVKGMYVQMGPDVQHFLRRWHVRNEFRNLLALQHLSLGTPEAVAWGCERRFGLPVRSFLVQRAISDGVDFGEYVARPGDPEQRLAAFRSVGEAVRALHEAGWIHGDLACRNLMLRPGGQVVFVDLARVKPANPDRIDWGRRKELYRLVKSADKCGASPEEVEVMLRAVAGDAAEGVIAATRGLRAIDRRMSRKWRTWVWRATGRTP